MSAFDLLDVYARPSAGATFTSAKRAVGHIREPVGPTKMRTGRPSAECCMSTTRSALTNGVRGSWVIDPPTVAPADSREGRLQLMLFAALGNAAGQSQRCSRFSTHLWMGSRMRSELVELLDVLQGARISGHRAIDPFGVVPIHSHATYSRYEILAAYGAINIGRLREAREGVMWNEAHRTDLFFVTLDKSADTFSPTTRYNDYPISPTRFHWESQSTTSSTSPVGQRYINHAARGSSVVLFVREVNDDERDESNPFVCLGRARFVSQQSSKAHADHLGPGTPDATGDLQLLKGCRRIRIRADRAAPSRAARARSRGCG